MSCHPRPSPATGVPRSLPSAVIPPAEPSKLRGNLPDRTLARQRQALLDVSKSRCRCSRQCGERWRTRIVPYRPLVVKRKTPEQLAAEKEARWRETVRKMDERARQERNQPCPGWKPERLPGGQRDRVVDCANCGRPQSAH